MRLQRDVVLLDVDGVLLDNARYDPEFERLGGAAFAPLLGGDPAGWAEAQRRAWDTVQREARLRHARLPADVRPSLRDWWFHANSEWIEASCALMGVPAPLMPAARVAAAERALTYFFLNADNAFPGVAEAVTALAKRAELHMASGNQAFVVECVLTRLGVRELVGRPFGTDLLGADKEEGAEFYEAILTAIGADPERVTLVDDADRALRAAGALGIRTVKIGPRSLDCDLAIDSLAELSEALERL
jgi:FMN phosphatase YigB (HAD superfamily)